MPELSPVSYRLRNSGYGAGVAAGGQYAPVTHFGFFGEIGLHFERSKTTSTSVAAFSGRTATWSTEGTMGIVLYF